MCNESVLYSGWGVFYSSIIIYLRPVNFTVYKFCLKIGIRAGVVAQG